MVKRVHTQRHRGPKVLVVDDYVDARHMVAQYLRMEGFRVAQAGSAAEALARAVRILPDVVLMDLCMPGMDGWEAISQLRHRGATQQVPIVALTALPDQAAHRRALEAGCQSVIVKPCDLELLLEEIRRVLRDSAAAADLTAVGVAPVADRQPVD